ncbi:hypothetical protein LTR95_016015 [Oleoguttula sp. CCFEE 5521]
MSAQAEFFAHNDLLPLIALQLPRSSIAALRLMNSHINRQIARYMFRTLRLRFHSWYMNRLYWIAANPTLRKGVRELVFDTASYYPREQEGDVPGEIGSILTAYIQQALEEAGLSMRNTAEGNRQCIALRKHHDEATRDENDAMNAWLGDPSAADEALLALQGCTTLTLTPWSGPGHTFFSRESLTGERNALPPPLADLSSRSHTYLVQNAARLMLIGEPHRLRHQFKVLNILGASQNAFGVGNRDSHRRNFPGTALWWNKRCPVPMTLRRQLPSTSPLTQLRLELELENLDDTALRAFVETTTDASFAGLWSMAPNLRELDLEIRVRPQLPFSDGRYEFAAHSTFSVQPRDRSSAASPHSFSARCGLSRITWRDSSQHTKAPSPTSRSSM